jgi:uncharacterized protein with HEPN domain
MLKKRLFGVNKGTALLEHIKDEIDFLELQFSKNTKEDLLSDPLLQRETVKSLEIIVEAVQNLSDDFKANNSEIEWKKIAGMRDKLVHQYFGVDWNIVWEVIQEWIPELKELVYRVLG